MIKKTNNLFNNKFIIPCQHFFKFLNYSDENHLLNAGGTSYQHDVDGFLTTKTNGQDIIIYDYSSRGELLSALMPDGRNIEYDHDPLGRRIAKKCDSYPRSSLHLSKLNCSRLKKYLSNISFSIFWQTSLRSLDQLPDLENLDKD